MALISGGGGGGSSPSSVVRGPFAFAFNTPNLNNGVAYYTPTIGDILLDAWIEVTTAWNGTNPIGDTSQFGIAETRGWFFHGVNMATADANYAQGLLSQGALTAEYPSGLTQMQAWEGQPLAGGRFAPGRFLTADPVQIVVSQDGNKGGDATGATQGTGRVYLVTATPVAFT